MNTVIEFNYSNSTDDWSTHGNSGGKPLPRGRNNHLKLFELAEALNVREKALGSEHLNTLQSRHNMSSGFYDMGRVQEAVSLYEYTMRIRERAPGPEHPDTLDSRNNLARGYYSLGRVSEAVRLYEGTLITRERVLGPKHPDTLHSREFLDAAYRSLGN
ncbi:MAG: tetratricopeptide repeat protein [Chloroflexota bacterium]|nr:tetratricopeptide repeat protein [Chloroflexota bacterium]